MRLCCACTHYLVFKEPVEPFLGEPFKVTGALFPCQALIYHCDTECDVLALELAAQLRGGRRHHNELASVWRTFQAYEAACLSVKTKFQSDAKKNLLRSCWSKSSADPAGRARDVQ